MRKEKRFIYVAAEQWATWQALAKGSGLSSSAWVVQVVTRFLASGGAARLLIDSAVVTDPTHKNSSPVVLEHTAENATSLTPQQEGYHADKHIKANMQCVVAYDPKWYLWEQGPPADAVDLGVKFGHWNDQKLHIIDENGQRWWAVLEAKKLYPRL